MRALIRVILKLSGINFLNLYSMQNEPYTFLQVNLACFSHESRESKMIPRFFASFTKGMGVLFIMILGQLLVIFSIGSLE
jgi:hypothetical protein